MKVSANFVRCLVRSSRAQDGGHPQIICSTGLLRQRIVHIHKSTGRAQSPFNVGKNELDFSHGTLDDVLRSVPRSPSYTRAIVRF
jgi:hypothetical protein